MEGKTMYKQNSKSKEINVFLKKSRPKQSMHIVFLSSSFQCWSMLILDKGFPSVSYVRQWNAFPCMVKIAVNVFVVEQE